MTLCSSCEREFPDEILAPLIYTDEDGTKVHERLCAPCAYNIISAIHGRVIRPRPGMVAYEMYKKARKLYPKRKNHEPKTDSHTPSE